MKAKDCFTAILLLLAICAVVCGTFCLGIAFLQLAFGTGRNIVMAYWGFCLLVSGIFLGKLIKSLE